ncbi:ATP-binding protein [Syntrophus gentianae]
MGQLFQDAVIVTAFVDRMLHHSVVINIRGSKLQASGKNRKEGC